MTGVDIVGALLRAEAAERPVAPDSVKAGMLPEGMALPALLVRSVSTIERLRLKRGTVVRTVERVSVTVRAASYREQVAIMKWARARCSGWVGNMAPAERISILFAGIGPDLLGPGNSFEQGTDFRVSFDEPA